MNYTKCLLTTIVIPGILLVNPLKVESKPVPENTLTAQINSNQNQKAPAAQPIYRVPILRRASGVPVVGVSFNGNNAVYPLLLDTAASVTVISKDIADQVKWVQTGSVEAALSSGERITIPIGRVRSIQVGGASINDFVAAVGPVPLLGANFHSQFTMLITRNQVLLRPNSPEESTQSPSVRNSSTPKQ
ncbi:retropepsin-like aspartic protease family protein [Leptolyngbya sp. AN03gr2]|uniref:retropepsin-like aspartic protease family protein n=1 Tax=unclassified Leptolyngbya TaxID=2650499 RepID=UPI003D31A690